MSPAPREAFHLFSSRTLLILFLSRTVSAYSAPITPERKLHLAISIFVLNTFGYGMMTDNDGYYNEVCRHPSYFRASGNFITILS